jgi:hypothetical protein
MRCSRTLTRHTLKPAGELQRMVWQEGRIPMNGAMKARLEHLEFRVLDLTVRFFEGGASAEEVHAAREELRRVWELASSRELVQRELFTFRRSKESARAGH